MLRFVTSFIAIKRIFRTALVLLLTGCFIYLIADYNGPEEIKLKADRILGFKGYRAEELIVQGYDDQKNLYATRGMIIYRLENGSDRFLKFAHVPTGFSMYWFRNFSLVRKFTLRPECMEIIASGSGEIVALSAGGIWTYSDTTKTFRKSMDLTHYRKGDQGILDNGMVRLNDSTYCFGEYFRNEERQQVRVYVSTDRGYSWNVNYSFKPGEIRHIHALHKDPFEDKIWICTGDVKTEPRIAWSDDNYKTLHNIGSGSQVWRATQLVFDKDYVYWGADTYDQRHEGVYRWNRKTKKVDKLAKVEGVIFHSTMLKNGTMVMTTNREGGPNEKDLKTKMLLFSGKKLVRTINVGTWHSNKPGFWFKYARLRLQRDQGAPALAVSCLSQTEFSNGELLLIPEESFAEQDLAESDSSVSAFTLDYPAN